MRGSIANVRNQSRTLVSALQQVHAVRTASEETATQAGGVATANQQVQGMVQIIAARRATSPPQASPNRYRRRRAVGNASTGVAEITHNMQLVAEAIKQLTQAVIATHGSTDDVARTSAELDNVVASFNV